MSVSDRKIKELGDTLAEMDWIPWPATKNNNHYDWDKVIQCSECGHHRGGNSQEDIDEYRNDIATIIEKVRAIDAND